MQRMFVITLECDILLKKETHELLYSLEKELFTQYGKSRLTWKQNIDVNKEDPNLGDLRYHHVNFHVSHNMLPTNSIPNC